MKPFNKRNEEPVVETTEEYTQLTLDDLENLSVDPEEVVDVENNEPTVVDEEISTEPNAVISGCPKLNIRKSNSTDAEILTVLDEGTELFAAETDAEWMVVITAAGIEGYAMKKFIKMK